MIITLDQFHSLLHQSYAVCVNNVLYFVGYDEEENPYISTNDGEDYIDLSSVDGDITLDEYAAFFYVQEQPVRVVFLIIMDAMKDGMLNIF